MAAFQSLSWTLVSAYGSPSGFFELAGWLSTTANLPEKAKDRPWAPRQWLCPAATRAVVGRAVCEIERNMTDLGVGRGSAANVPTT